MTINTNVSSLFAQLNTNNAEQSMTLSMERMSSGTKINSAADDASGLAIADKLRTQNSSIVQSISNANSAIALVQIADKAMEEQSTILDSIKSKLLQATTATTSADGREAIRQDIVKLLTQFDDIADQTNYNGINLLQKDAGDTAVGDALSFQVGELSSNTITTDAGIQSNSVGLSLDTLKGLAADGLTSAAATTALDLMDDAITDLNNFRGGYGSTQVQLESSVRNLSSMSVQIQAAESVIRDTDYAAETANYNKQNIISQAGVYSMSQANALASNVLRLLQ